LPDEVVEHYTQHADEIPLWLRRGAGLEKIVETEASKVADIYVPTLKTPHPVLTASVEAIERFSKKFNFIAPDLTQLAKLVTESYRDGFNRCFFVKKEWTGRHILETFCGPQFRVWEGIQIEDFPSTEKRPDGDYLILVRDNVEPDREWLDKTSDEMANTETPFLSIEERSLFEAYYFFKEKKHLDIKGWTRCPRSRNSAGGVADARWISGGGGFRVGCRDPDSRGPDAGGRAAVILVP
jgi:hypothetical protein